MDNDRNTDNMDTSEAERIIKAYWPIMRKTMDSGKPVHPESLLPYPKARIIDALLFAITQTQSTVKRAQLRLCLIKLGCFQPLPRSEKSGIFKGISRLLSPNSPSDDSAFDLMNPESLKKWNEIVSAEQISLLDKLKEKEL